MLERFIPTDDPTDDSERVEPQYALYRSNPEWRRIYSFLRRGYWHVTNPKSWEDIRKSRAIQPNLGGRYTARWGSPGTCVEPTLTDRSYAYIHKCVALFDFVYPSENEVIHQWGNAWDVLTDQGASTILIRLDRRRLRSKIIPNREGRKIVDDRAFGCIPYCEVWYPDEIPTTFVIGVYEVPPPAGFEFKPKPICNTR
jgi:hypothetical protein